MGEAGRRLGVRTLALMVLMLLGAAGMQVLAQGQTPRAPVTDFENALIDAMRQSGSTSLEQRKQALAAMVERSFDIQAIARAVIARHWDGLAAGDRQALTHQINDYAVTILATRFVDYEGERFEARGQSAMDATHTRVRSRFLSSDGSSTALDYVVRRGEKGQRIVNVYFDGVSGTDIQRAEFEVFLRDGGPQALIQKLKALIAAQGA